MPAEGFDGGTRSDRWGEPARGAGGHGRCSRFTIRAAQRARRKSPLSFGLTPVFLTNDLELLTKLKTYLSRKCGREVELVQRRTYEEITALLVSAQLHAAWICGYPFVAYRDQLSLVGVPVWRGRPLYQSYIITARGQEKRRRSTI